MPPVGAVSFWCGAIPLGAVVPACGPFLSTRSVTHGVTTKATSSEKNIAALALIGIGRMYGPMSPLTNASGRSEAMTVKVARIVGLPTSSVA